MKRRHSEIRRLRAMSGSAAVLLLTVTGVARAQNVPPASVTHPAQTTLPPNVSFSRVGTTESNLSPSIVAQDANWTIYSQLVNQISCVSTYENEVWLGTGFGVKMLDRRTGTVRHFTQAEGLPELRVLAIAAEHDAVWGMVQSPAREKTDIILCRYDRAQSRWQKIGAMPRAVVSPYSAGGVTVAPLENAAIAVMPNFVGFARSPGTTGERAPLVLWDKKRNQMQPVVWPAELQGAQPFLNITFLSAEGDGLWIGGNVGLLRYEPSHNEWQRYLPLRNILAGVQKGEEFWLVNAPLDGHPAPAPDARLDGGEAAPSVWGLTQFRPRTGTLKEFAAPQLSAVAPLDDGERPDIGVLLGVSAGEGRVWVTTWANERNNRRPWFHRLDVATGGWISFVPQNPQDLDIVPDYVLMQPVRSSVQLSTGEFRQRLLASFAAERFPTWFCAPVNIPFAVTAANSWQASSTVAEEGEGHDTVVWQVRNNSVLVKTKRVSGPGDEQLFSLPPPEAFPPRAPATSADPDNPPDTRDTRADGFVPRSPNEFGRDTAIVQDAKAVWAWRASRDAERLYVARFDRGTQQWSVISDEGLPARKYVLHMWADGDSLWAAMSDDLYHLDIKNNRWAAVGAMLSLAPGADSVRAGDVLPLGPDVWLLMSGIGGWVSQPGGAPTPPRPPLLIRYHKATGQFETFTPDNARAYFGLGLLDSGTGLIITTAQGLFRFNTGASTWQRLDDLPEFQMVAAMGPLHIVRVQGAVWFLCRDGIARRMTAL